MRSQTLTANTSIEAKRERERERERERKAEIFQTASNWSSGKRPSTDRPII